MGIVDRAARDKLATIIESYLDDQITAFEFDERIDEIADQMHDETIKYVRKALWFHYDDCKDHRVVLCKEQWDYFHRLLLLLRSSGSVHVFRRWVWSSRQVWAWSLLVCFWFIVIQFDLGLYVLAVLLPVGVGSIVISRYEPKPFREKRDCQARITPFRSVTQMLRVRRTLPNFKKRSYPVALGSRRIRHAFWEMDVTWALFMIWVIFSPFVLLFQCFPSRHERVIVTT